MAGTIKFFAYKKPIEKVRIFIIHTKFEFKIENGKNEIFIQLVRSHGYDDKS